MLSIVDFFNAFPIVSSIMYPLFFLSDGNDFLPFEDIFFMIFLFTLGSYINIMDTIVWNRLIR